MNIKKLLILFLTGIITFSFTACGDSSEDPEVKAYDEWYIRTHDIFGNPR